jgi:hypothetical protein
MRHLTLTTCSFAMRRICIKGREDDEAVLCTPTETYEMKAADTSNTVMVANLPVGGIQMVQGLTPYAYELRKVRLIYT